MLCAIDERRGEEKEITSRIKLDFVKLLTSKFYNLTILIDMKMYFILMLRSRHHTLNTIDNSALQLDFILF